MLNNLKQFVFPVDYIKMVPCHRTNLLREAKKKMKNTSWNTLCSRNTYDVSKHHTVLTFALNSNDKKFSFMTKKWSDLHCCVLLNLFFNYVPFKCFSTLSVNRHINILLLLIRDKCLFYCHWVYYCAFSKVRLFYFCSFVNLLSHCVCLLFTLFCVCVFVCLCTVSSSPCASLHIHTPT